MASIVITNNGDAANGDPDIEIMFLDQTTKRLKPGECFGVDIEQFFTVQKVEE